MFADEPSRRLARSLSLILLASSLVGFPPVSKPPAPTTVRPTVRQVAYTVKPPQPIVETARVEAITAPVPTPTPIAVVRSVPITGNKYTWMTLAGIAPTDYAHVDYIISNESGWNPCSYNPHQSDCSKTAAQVGNHACGLGQQLPCGKWIHTWNDPVGGLIDASAYALARYGSWANAEYFWRIHHYW